MKGEVFTTGSARTADFATLRDCTRFPNLPSNIVILYVHNRIYFATCVVVSMEFVSNRIYFATCVVVSWNFVASWAYESHFSTS